jgi:GST-like protein
MIRVYYWPTPNGHKVTIFLEEAGLPYEIVPVDIRRGEQFKPDFLAISPNNRMPAITDDAPVDGGAPISVFESGAILVYLAEKTGRFLPRDARGRVEVMEWLMWQAAGVGPMLGQAGHFRSYASETIPYAIKRYTAEASRLFGVLERRLAHRDWVGADYSVADMAIFPWVREPERFGHAIESTPNVKRWLQAVQSRPAVVRALAKADAFSAGPLDEDAKRILFGQSSSSVEEHAAKRDGDAAAKGAQR